MSKRENNAKAKEILEQKKKFQSLKKMNHRKLDDIFHTAHTSEFKKMDCLTCANCCKTTSPIFRDVDIQRISKIMGIKSQKFIETYLKMDEESDYVLTQSPCVFLEVDNTCSIYDDRPLACKEYPHTNRKNIYQILDLTTKNMEICPVVERIVQSIEIGSKKQ
jgi:hypothetical protein